MGRVATDRDRGWTAGFNGEAWNERESDEWKRGWREGSECAENVDLQSRWAP